MLAESKGKLLLEHSDLLLEGSVALAGIVAGTFSLPDGLGELDGLGAELRSRVLVPDSLVLEVGDGALDVDDLATLSLDVILEVVTLDVDETKSVLLVVESSLESLNLDSDVGKLVVGGCDFPLGLLKTKVEIGDVSLGVAEAGGLLLELLTKTLNDGDMLVTLGLSSTKSGAKGVDVTLEVVVSGGHRLKLSCKLQIPGIGTLELVLQTVPLIKDLRALVLKSTCALGEVDDFFAGSLKLCLKVGVLVSCLCQLSCEVAIVATLPLTVVNSIVALGLTVAQLDVLGLKLGLECVVVELLTGE